MNKVADAIRSFGMSGYLISTELSGVETVHGVSLGHLGKAGTDEVADYYKQFEERVRSEATKMSQHYELFYCLETSIRALLSDTLSEAHGGAWWSSERVPERIRNDVDGRINRELDSGVTRRSDSPIDYTTFGELAVIITTNWDLFGAIFSSRRAVERVMSSLNLLRGPIAHCCPITDDEVDRLDLTVKDWFRTMA